jgi:Flp pilus assembly protein TadG
MQIQLGMLRRFLRCESGVTALEFAFVSPVLLLFIVGILEFAMIFLASNVMENAVNNASRTGKTGYVESGISREQTLLNAISERIGGFLDPSKITIAATTYESFDDIGQGEPYTDSDGSGAYEAGETFTDTNGNGQWDSDMGSSGYGNSGEVVVYRISYPWNLMTPLLGNIIGTDGVLTLSTRIVVRNEPYTDSST